MLKIIFSGLAILIVSVGLTGCFGGAGETATTYMINTVPSSVVKAKRSSSVLLVRMPQANTAYNTTQMAYMTNNYQLSYFVKNRWAATPPQMLLPLMVQTLQNTRAFRAVIPSTTTGNASLVLDTQLIQLQQEFSGQSSQIHLVMRAQLSNGNTQHIIATKEFNIVEPTTANNPYAGVAATNQAVSRFLQQLAVFCVRHR